MSSLQGVGNKSRTPPLPDTLFPGDDRLTHPEGLWGSLNERYASSTEQLRARSVCRVFFFFFYSSHPPLSSFFPPSFPLGLRPHFCLIL